MSIDTPRTVRKYAAVMASDPEGLRIARERIAKEKEDKTGVLNLGT